MHTHSVIVRGPRGKEFVLDGDNQYHEAMKRGDFPEKDSVRNPVVTEFNPQNEDTPMSKAMDPSRSSFNDAVLPAASRGPYKKREHNLGSPSEVQQRQTLFRNEMEKAHAEQKEEAPNMNTDPHLTQFTKTVSERVKERRRKTTPTKKLASKAAPKSSSKKAKPAKSVKTSDKPLQVRLNTKEDKEAGRQSKRMGMTQQKRTGIAGRYMDAKDRGHF